MAFTRMSYGANSWASEVVKAEKKQAACQDTSTTTTTTHTPVSCTRSTTTPHSLGSRALT